MMMMMSMMTMMMMMVVVVIVMMMMILMMVIDIGDDAKLLVNFKGGWCWVKRHSGNDVIQFTRWKRNILITVVHLFFAPMGSSKKIRLPEHVKITTEYAIMPPVAHRDPCKTLQTKHIERQHHHMPYSTPSCCNRHHAGICFVRIVSLHRT
jgi:hypothetical protein